MLDIPAASPNTDWSASVGLYVFLLFFFLFPPRARLAAYAVGWHPSARAESKLRGLGQVDVIARERAAGSAPPGDRLAAPTTVWWPEFDPLFPRDWNAPGGELAGSTCRSETRHDEAYFEPLRDLELPRDTELYLGLVHRSDGLEGSKRASGIDPMADLAFEPVPSLK